MNDLEKEEREYFQTALRRFRCIHPDRSKLDYLATRLPYVLDVASTEIEKMAMTQLFTKRINEYWEICGPSNRN